MEALWRDDIVCPSIFWNILSCMTESVHAWNSTEVTGPRKQGVVQIQMTGKSKGFPEGGSPKELSSYHAEMGRDALWEIVEQETHPTGIWACQELSQQ